MEPTAAVKKIGFLDYFLDEWHANNYPGFIRKASGGRMEAAYAYGHIDAPSGRTTEKWCADMGLSRCATIDELLEKSDYLIVLSPDNPEMHWELCQKPLRSGKRVYVDKTFAPTAQIARDLFALAEESGTPLYSSSALRYAEELAALPEKEAEFVCMNGPGLPENYLIHQLEPLVAVMKAPAKRILCTRTQTTTTYLIEFAGGKIGSATLLGWGGDCPFSSVIRYTDGTTIRVPDASAYFDRFIAQMLHFFETGSGAVDKAETISVMALIEAGHRAETALGEWTPVDDGC